MINLVKEITGAATKGAEVADNLTESGEERQATLSARHSADMNSDSKLSKSIRPLVLLVLLFLQVVIVVLSALGYHVDIAIVTQHGVLLTGAFGFYFNSRKVEKVAARNALANIQMERQKQKHEIRKERKQLRADRKAARRQERVQDGL